MSQGSDRPIGVLTDWIDSSYQLLILRGVFEAARERGIGVVCLTNGLPCPGPDACWWPAHQIIRKESLAGLIVCGTSVALHSDAEREQLLSSVLSLPVCSIGMDLPGASSVCIDNPSGIREVVRHLVQTHGHRRLAYVGGPEYNVEARQRLAGFRATLAELGLAVDERLILPGDFTVPSGERAMRILLEERGVPVGEVDAIVAANDGMAWSCVDFLEARGVRVPWQLAIAGFDDVAAGRQARVPLTTVRQPVAELGRRAVQLLLAQVEGAAPEREVLRTQLVTRRSCGCVEGIGSLPLADADRQRRGGRSFEVALLERRERILADMQRASRGELGTLGAGWEMRMVTALVDELKGRSSDAFRLALDDGLSRVAGAGGDPADFHEVVSALWRHLIPCVLADTALRTTVEGLLDGARVAIGAAALRVQSAEQAESQVLARSLVTACVAVAASGSLEEVAAVVMGNFRALGVPRLEIAIFPDGKIGDTVTRVFAFDGAQCRLERAELRVFDLLDQALSGSGRREIIVSGLHWRGTVFGVVWMDLQPPSQVVHDAVREAMSAVAHRLGLG
jgi:phosphoserine phosphatase RsbU/P